MAPAPGFIIAENGTSAYIVNNQGEVVWAHKFPVSLSRALMSFDGDYLYGREVGPFDSGTGGSIYRVAMDGTGEMKLTVSGGTHHDLTVTPTGIAYPAKPASGNVRQHLRGRPGWLELAGAGGPQRGVREIFARAWRSGHGEVPRERHPLLQRHR